MSADGWRDVTAKLLIRLGWSWAELAETPMDVVLAVVDALAAQHEESAPSPAGETPIELG